MRNDLYYYTIDKAAFAEFKDKGSRFIAYAYPITKVDDFKKHLQAIKKEHPKAVHHCFAYRLGLDGNTFRVSDDGEPSSTAGKPILNMIDSNELTNILIIVVRYFGGTLLGVSGLITAYKSAAAMALQLIPFVQKPVEINYELQFDYTIMKLGMAHPMGPLQLADFIGLDVCLSVLNVLKDGFGNPKYAPCPLLVNMVMAGKLGIKSGEGFYTYLTDNKALQVSKIFNTK